MQHLLSQIENLTQKNKVLIIGSAFVDVVSRVDSLPLSGQDKAAQYLGTNVGGCSFNVADVFFKLGLPFESFMPIGKGVISKTVKAEFERRSYPIFEPETNFDNGWCLTLVDDTCERTFISFSGIEEQIEFDWLKNIDLTQIDYIYFSGYQLFGKSEKSILKFLELIDSKTQVFFDPGPRVGQISEKTLEQIFALNPIVKVNLQEAKVITGKEEAKKAAQILRSKTQNDVILTHGKFGATLFGETENIFQKSFKLGLADTSGSGDSFVGGYLLAQSAGLTKKDSMLLASLVAAFVTSKVGSATAPTLKELIEVLNYFKGQENE